MVPQQAIAGTGQPTNQNEYPPGSLFGWPMFGTQPRIIPDSGNGAIGDVLDQSSPVVLPTTRLDQLDIVRGMKVLLELEQTWTEGGGKTLTPSPFFPANQVQFVNFQLQAAYNTINLPGFLAAAFQAFRPSWGDRGLGASTPDNFAIFGQTPNVTGTEDDETFIVDIPFAIKLDEYFDLSSEGQPQQRFTDAIVGVEYMAAQSKVIVPTITMAGGITLKDLLNGPVAKAAGDTTSTYEGQVAKGKLYRDAWWTGQNPASNPPEYAWIYTRDYFRQPTQGQQQVDALIQNTGVSVGQVLSLVAVTWDPDANGGLGSPVALADIDHWELVTGGTLQNIKVDPEMVQDRMRSLYGAATADNLINAGIFVFDFCLSEDGSYLSNANAINTYVVNGVQLSCYFNRDTVPGSKAQMFVGVEALKMATS